MGVSKDCPKFLGTPILCQERIKLRTSNFVGTFIGSSGTKDHENVGNSSRGRSQGVPKIQGTLGRIARSSLRQHSFLVIHYINNDTVADELVVMHLQQQTHNLMYRVAQNKHS